MRLLSITLSSALLLAAGHASAAIFTIFGIDVAPVDGTPAGAPNAWAARSAFDAVFGGNVSVENFESYPLGSLLPPVPPFGLETATFSGAAGTILARFDSAGGVTASALATSATKTYGDDEDWIFVNQFTPPGGPIGAKNVNGLGFFGINVDAPLTWSVSYKNGGISNFNVATVAGATSVFFFGSVNTSSPIAGAVGGLPLNVGSGFYLMDDLVVGVFPVPAPAALALFGLGALGLAFRRR